MDVAGIMQGAQRLGSHFTALPRCEMTSSKSAGMRIALAATDGGGILQGRYAALAVK
jgi:hypothetical protein